ncbi:MAG: xanthine dehydrogenase family protein subunit M [Luteitalea sp.]|nr:xanthine dehydrogenase family protein subunit M [Luteitalea sp.]
MYPSAFGYYRAASVQEAVALLGEHPDAKLLAGGHSLIPAMKLRLATPSALVDLGSVAELRGIRQQGETIVIGAMTPHREIEYSTELAKTCPILPEAAAVIGDPLVRNRGTIGGSLAHADPAADFPACVLALGGTLTIQGTAGGRTVEAADFFQDMFATALQPGEVLTEIQVPARQPGVGMAYEKFAHPASRYAIVGVAAVVRMNRSVCEEARVAMTGATSKPTRLTKLEAALAGKPLDEATLKATCVNVVSPDGLLGDHTASATFRAHLTDVFAKRALQRAAERSTSR